jgi:hypothetical protein
MVIAEPSLPTAQEIRNVVSMLLRQQLAANRGKQAKNA